MRLFSVIKVYEFNSLIMKLDLSETMQIHSVFYILLLKLYKSKSNKDLIFYLKTILLKNEDK